VVSALVKMMNELKQKTQLLAPTGRAAKVIANYSGYAALTIHKRIYRQKSMAEFRFQLADNLSTNTLFIVDEASMISNSGTETTFGTGNLLDDLVHYIYSGTGCSLLVIGDVAQLPPVMQTHSPALEADKLSGYGLNVVSYTLKHVVRQALESGILHNATLLRSAMIEDKTFQFPKFKISPFSDILRLDGQELIDEIQRSYDGVGVEDTIVITRSNKRANIYNNGIRSRVMMKEDELTNGDLLMVTRNNYFWNKPYKEIDFIANGDIMEVMRVRKYYNIYDFRFVDLTLRSLDYGWEIDARVWLDSLQSESPTQMNELTGQLFDLIAEDYPEITIKKERVRKVMGNEFFNALQVKFAYAVTCHKAQGGQWKRVFVDQGQLTDQHLGVDYYRWLYTALTRAQEKLYLVNFTDNCFE
jgi:exodeoxyribonuclease-5